MTDFYNILKKYLHPDYFTCVDDNGTDKLAPAVPAPTPVPNFQVISDDTCALGGRGADYMVRSASVAGDDITINGAPEHFTKCEELVVPVVVTGLADVSAGFNSIIQASVTHENTSCRPMTILEFSQIPEWVFNHVGAPANLVANDRIYLQRNVNGTGATNLVWGYSGYNIINLPVGQRFGPELHGQINQVCHVIPAGDTLTITYEVFISHFVSDNWTNNGTSLQVSWFGSTDN